MTATIIKFPIERKIESKEPQLKHGKYILQNVITELGKEMQACDHEINRAWLNNNNVMANFWATRFDALEDAVKIIREYTEGA